MIVYINNSQAVLVCDECKTDTQLFKSDLTIDGFIQPSTESILCDKCFKHRSFKRKEIKRRIRPKNIKSIGKIECDIENDSNRLEAAINALAHGIGPVNAK